MRAALSTIASGPDLRAIAIAAADVADDGIDMHQAIRERPVADITASASPVAASCDEPAIRNRSFLPERPPRLA